MIGAKVVDTTNQIHRAVQGRCLARQSSTPPSQRRDARPKGGIQAFNVRRVDSASALRPLQQGLHLSHRPLDQTALNSDDPFAGILFDDLGHQDAIPWPQSRTPDLSSPTPAAVPVQVLSVGFAGDAGMIMVRFLAPPDEAEKWWQGSVSVTDEGNGAVYNEIPVMPKIGPLIGRPKIEGQAGYVMLVNTLPWLRPGATVTVVLGAYIFEHIPVQ